MTKVSNLVHGRKPAGQSPRLHRICTFGVLIRVYLRVSAACGGDGCRAVSR